MITTITTRTSIVRSALVAVAVLAVGALGNNAFAGDNDSSYALQHSKLSGVERVDRANRLGRPATPVQTGRVNYYTSFGDGQTVARIDAINKDGRPATPVQTGRVNYYTSFGDGQTVARIDAINKDNQALAQHRPAPAAMYVVTPSPASQAYDGSLASVEQYTSSM